jgi:hypothetical protein
MPTELLPLLLLLQLLHGATLFYAMLDAVWYRPSVLPLCRHRCRLTAAMLGPFVLITA